jgi:hypothetical protein
LSIFSVIANKKKWWVTKRPLFLGIPVDYTVILGPFFVGTLWVFKQTYGNFPKYLLTNILLNYINSYIFITISEKVGVLAWEESMGKIAENIVVHV